MSSSILEKYKDYLNAARQLQVAYASLEESQSAFSTTFAEQCALYREYSELQCLKVSLRIGDLAVPNLQAEMHKHEERIHEIESAAPWLKGKSKNSAELAQQFNVSEDLLLRYIKALHDIMVLKKQLITLQSGISIDLRNTEIPDSEKQQALSWSMENLANVTTEIQQRDNALVGEFQQSLLEKSKFLAPHSTERLGKEKYRAMFDTDKEMESGTPLPPQLDL